MNHWLLKTEPAEWSWADQVAKGVEPWTGVRNNLAARHMRAMRQGDRCFFYHTGEERRIVGIVEVAREFYPDPADAAGRFGIVDVRTLAPLPRPVTLGEIKADARFAGLDLVRQSRLSVMPIDDRSWRALCALGGVEP